MQDGTQWATVRPCLLQIQIFKGIQCQEGSNYPIIIFFIDFTYPYNCKSTTIFPILLSFRSPSLQPSFQKPSQAIPPSSSSSTVWLVRIKSDDNFSIYLSYRSHYFIYSVRMAASFASRLSNLRQKKLSQPQDEGAQLRLTLPPDSSQKSTYEPSATFNNTRSSFRLLKNRIDRGQSTQKQQIVSNNIMNDSKGLSSIQKISLQEESKPSLKLVLNDDPYIQEKKPISEPPKIPLQKRILIAKQPSKQEPKKEEPPRREEPKKVQEPPKVEKKQQQKIVAHEEKPIKEQEFQESLPAESQNDLVLCPQGCGRKFNRKALEKHAKACKLVFMSKRKEFNSEAKRITSKEQVVIAKQTKMQEKKKMGMTKGKGGFGATKTGQNWKAASEDFRAAVKAMKKEQKDQKEEEEEANVDLLEEKKVVNVMCDFCEKMFNEVFIEKHQENCVKKKEKEREKEKKKTGKK